MAFMALLEEAVNADPHGFPKPEEGPEIPAYVTLGAWLCSKSGKTKVRVIGFLKGLPCIFVARTGQDDNDRSFVPWPISIEALTARKWLPCSPPSRYDLIRNGGLPGV